MNFYDELGEQVKVAAERSHHKRQQRKTFAQYTLTAVVLIAFVSVASLTVLSPDSAVAETVKVKQVENAVSVQLLDINSDPQKVKADLEEEGFDVRIQKVPTGPSKVNTVLRLESDSVSQTDSPYEITVSSTAQKITLGVGVLSDDTYDITVDPFAEGEPLHCVDINPLTVETLSQHAESHGLIVTFQQTPNTSKNSSGTEYVTSVVGTSSTTLFAIVSPSEEDMLTPVAC